MYIINFHPK